MEIIETKSVMSYIMNSRPMGIGTTAICFLNPSGMVFKYYLNTSGARELLSRKDIVKHMEKLSELSNSTFKGPEKLLFVNGQLVGYFYPYVEGKVLKRISSNTTISDLFSSYEQLLKDTEYISSKGFSLYDLHDRNILFNGSINVIDLDKGSFSDSYLEQLSKINIRYIVDQIIWHIFKTKPWEIPELIDPEINHLLFKTNLESVDNINEIIRGLSIKCGDADPTIKKVREKIKVRNEYNSYYKF